MDKATRDMIGTGAFAALLASLDADQLESFTIPGLPAPFGDGEPIHFTVALVGRTHLQEIDNSLKCHVHDSEDEARMCHDRNTAETHQKITTMAYVVDAMRRRDRAGIIMGLIEVARGAGIPDDMARESTTSMVDDLMPSDGPEVKPPGQPLPYVPGRPVPDNVPPEWPGMYL